MVSGDGEVSWMEYLGQEASHGLEEVNEGGSFAKSGNFFFLSSSERLCEEKGPKDQGDTSSRKGMLQHKEDAQCTTYAVE